MLLRSESRREEAEDRDDTGVEEVEAVAERESPLLEDEVEAKGAVKLDPPLEEPNLCCP